MLWGHGFRERQFWGPRDREGDGEQVVLQLRRYLCQSCGAVVTVVPREALPGRLYAATAIALALALWSLDGASARAVRRRVAPGWQAPEEVRSWASLRRWAGEASSGRLWSRLQITHVEGARQRAGAVAFALAGFAPPGDRASPEPSRSWAGAVHAM